LNSLATWISVGNLDASSEIIFSHIALLDGGHPARTLLVTLSHFSSNFASFHSHSFSSSNTDLSLLAFLIAFLVNSIDIFTVFHAVELETYFISLYPLKYQDISQTRLSITSVFVQTGHSITKVVALLSSDGNNSNPTFGAIKNNENTKNANGRNIVSLLRKVFSKKLLNVFLYQLMVLCITFVLRETDESSIFTFHSLSSSSKSFSS